MTNYNLEVYNLNPSTGEYTRIGELITYTNLRWNKKANNQTYLSFDIDAYSPEGRFIQPFRTWILLKRNGTAEQLYNIADVRGGINSGIGTVNVMCFDILHSLINLYTEGSFVRQGVDAGTIASDLVTYAQAKGNSNFGIQIGTIQTVGTSNETLYYQSIGNAIINQADNIIGYDFFFTPILDSTGRLDYVQFNVLKAAGVVQNDLPPLELGHSVNIINFGINGEVYNHIYSLGSGTGDTITAESSNEDLEEYFGRREFVNKESAVSIQSTLQAKGDILLNNKQAVGLEVGFELTEGVKPYYGDFGLFDTLKMNISIGNTFFNFNGTVQVREILFSYDQENQEHVVLVVNYYKA